MAADVAERPQARRPRRAPRAPAVAGAGGEVAAGLGQVRDVPGELPGALEDALLLALEHRRVQVEGRRAAPTPGAGRGLLDRAGLHRLTPTLAVSGRRGEHRAARADFVVSRKIRPTGHGCNGPPPRPQRVALGHARARARAARRWSPRCAPAARRTRRPLAARARAARAARRARHRAATGSAYLSEAVDLLRDTPAARRPRRRPARARSRSTSLRNHHGPAAGAAGPRRGAHRGRARSRLERHRHRARERRPATDEHLAPPPPRRRRRARAAASRRSCSAPGASSRRS